MTLYYNGTLPAMSTVQANGIQILTVQEQLASLNEQYMGHIMRASVILLAYALYNFFFMMPRIEERTRKNIVFFHFNTVAVVMSLFLFIISLTYNGWLKL